MTNTHKQIRWSVFLIPLILSLLAVALNLLNGAVFNKVIMKATDFILVNFSWLFASMAFFCVLVVAAAYVLPFGNVRIGGRNARPIMGQANYVWIVLCTIMAAGILLWACAEPLVHLYKPPAHLTSGSPEALQFAMKNIFLEWSFTPMCIYGMPAILFAFLFYNAKKDYSVGSMMYPCLKERHIKKFTWIVDAICLLALICGMSASMGSAVFLLTDGTSYLTHGAVTGGPTMWIIIAAVIVAAFVASAVSGVMKGIRILSTINSRIYMSLGIFTFIFGPTAYILSLIVESFGAYLSDFCGMNLFISAIDGDKWAMWWPVFFWCNWMAWMPVTATFLGRISKGYTIREAIRVIVVYPSLFSIVWLGIFAATSVSMEYAGAGISDAMNSGGTAFATYAVLENLPIPVVTISVFLIIVFVSFVTASDSNTNAMSGLCTSGLTADDSESPNWLKIVWGIVMGAMCVVFVTAFKSVDAIKYLSNLGGFPVVFLLIVFSVSFIKIMLKPSKYDIHKEDYDEFGRPLPSERLTPQVSTVSVFKKVKKTDARHE